MKVAFRSVVEVSTESASAFHSEGSNTVETVTTTTRFDMASEREHVLEINPVHYFFIRQKILTFVIYPILIITALNLVRIFLGDSLESVPGHVAMFAIFIIGLFVYYYSADFVHNAMARVARADRDLSEASTVKIRCVPYKAWRSFRAGLK